MNFNDSTNCDSLEFGLEGTEIAIFVCGSSLAGRTNCVIGFHHICCIQKLSYQKLVPRISYDYLKAHSYCFFSERLCSLIAKEQKSRSIHSQSGRDNSIFFSVIHRDCVCVEPLQN